MYNFDLHTSPPIFYPCIYKCFRYVLAYNNSFFDNYGDIVKLSPNDKIPDLKYFKEYI